MARPAKPWFRSAENVWYVTHKGQKVSLGVRGRNNEAAAWREWERLKATGSQKVPSLPVSLVDQPPPKEVTVGEVISAFLEDAEGRVETGTLDLYRLFLKRFAVKHGDVTTTRLTCPVVESYSRRPNWNASTRAAFLAVLARAFRLAERSQMIARSPLANLKKPVIGSRAADVLVTAEEHEKLCDLSPLPFRTLLRFLWFTGCRPGEAAQLTASDIDWGAGTATIRKHKTKKSGKRRIVYLSPDALSLLRELAKRNPTGHLFRNRIGKPWTRVTTGAAMRKARDRAGLPKKILYGLRHSFATDALAAGVPDAQVAELLGHSSTAMLHRHYSHLGSKARTMAEALKRVR